MTFKRKALSALTRTELLEVGRELELGVTTNMRLDEMMDVVAGSKKRGLLDKILAMLARDTLKSVCYSVGISAEGREKQVLVDRILSAARGDEGAEDEESPAPKTKKPQKGEANKPTPVVMAPPAQVQVQMAWQGFPMLEPTPPPVTTRRGPLPGGPASDESGPPIVSPNDEITLDVPPRKPRLAWQGMWRRELATSVPTQVVEIVRPGRAIDRGELAGLEVRTAEARDVTTLPPNRLIWTNDNLVALQTLLDEKDPTTRDWRYRGKVDLVYIDPPFMVNNDFRADNTVDIDLGGDEEVQVKKEPSLVEVLAYKDTWRQGLDSFLTMLRRRLELLKELLAPTGSIYVHLDWHAVHYVKVLMDEVFGYENFRNEVVWRRTTAHNDPRQYGRINDRLLFYGNGCSYYFSTVYGEYTPEQIARYKYVEEATRRRYRAENLTAPHFSETRTVDWRGTHPGADRQWRYGLDERERLWAANLILKQADGRPRKDGLKEYLDEAEGPPAQDLWTDLMLGPTSGERLGYPTQKPVALLDRIISASCPPSGLVLDCFVGSGTTAEAAERLGRRWIGIDNGKYAIHLARKRLIQLHGQPRPPEKVRCEYVECDRCKNIDRKEKPQRSPGPFNVRPFTVENMGVYQRAEAWQDFQTKRSLYRDEMIKVFGGEPVHQSPLLHGKKGGAWIHVGPLDGPVSSGQVWSIAREAQRTTCKAVTILSADFDTLSGSEKADVQARTAVAVTVRVIPSHAIDEVRRRMAKMNENSSDAPIESMAIPAFYAPLSILLDWERSGRTVRLTLKRCEVDIESFLASQRPVFKASSGSMTPAARKKAEAELAKWQEREKALQKWLSKSTSWQNFVDFWAVDWDYFSRMSPDGKPIFETDWQSFRTRKGKGESEPLVFTAEFKYSQAGHYWIAAKVTDVFGNDGIATVQVEVK